MPPGVRSSTASMPTPDGEVGARALLAGADHLLEQARAVLDRAAVLVVAVVPGGRQELGEDVAVAGVQLDRVDAGAARALGRGRELLDQPARSSRVATWIFGGAPPLAAIIAPSSSRVRSRAMSSAPCQRGSDGISSSRPSFTSRRETLPWWTSWSASFAPCACTRRASSASPGR